MAVILGLSLHTLTKAVRLARELQDMRLVSEPVEQGRGQTFIAEDLCPVSESQIGRHKHGHPFVERGTELKDQLCAGGRERDEAQLIQDNQTVPKGGGHELGQLMFVLGLDQFVYQACGVLETHSMSLSADWDEGFVTIGYVILVALP